MDNNEDTFELFEKWVEEEILPFLIRNVALKNVDQFSEIGFTEGSEFDNGYDMLFQNREYENILDNHLYHHTLLAAEYRALHKSIDKILAATSKDD